MVTSINLHPPAWMDGIAVAAQDLRLQVAAGMLTGASPSGSTGIAARPGVRYGTGSPLLVQASSGMNVTVNAGVGFVQGTTSATSGMYTGCLDTTSTLTVATSDPTNPRIDNVIMRFVDNGNNTSTGTVELQTGTPAPSPVAPTLPANSLLLATIAVGAGVSSITSGNITDGRVYTAASGGIVPMANTTGGISGAAGMYVHDLSSGRLKMSDGSGNAVAPKTAPFAPVTATTTTAVTLLSSTTTTIVSASFTADGVTEVRALLNMPGIYLTSSPGSSQQFSIFCLLDGATSRQWPCTSPGNAAFVFAAGTYIQFMTPSAGTHTISFAVQNNGTPATTDSITTSPIYLRISAESG